MEKYYEKAIFFCWMASLTVLMPCTRQAEMALEIAEMTRIASPIIVNPGGGEIRRIGRFG